MIKNVSVAYIHTPNKELANWYEEKLGLKKGYGDDHWQSFEMEGETRFALDFIDYPSSTVEKQSMMISFEVDDIHKALSELHDKGVRIYPDNDARRAIHDVGPSLVVTCEDPDGNYFQLCQAKS
jgi:predicted enzyme related to lactoylglutathione lyase